jgi:hypothetical protein
MRRPATFTTRMRSPRQSRTAFVSPEASGRMASRRAFIGRGGSIGFPSIDACFGSASTVQRNERHVAIGGKTVSPKLLRLTERATQRIPENGSACVNIWLVEVGGRCAARMVGGAFIGLSAFSSPFLPGTGKSYSQ